MSSWPKVSIAWLAATLLAAASAAAAADGSAAVRSGGDVFLAGGTPTVSEPVAGDLFVAGGSVDVEAPVAGDIYGAGGRLQVAAEVGRSVHAMAGQVSVRSRVGANLRVAGGQVEVGPAGEVGANVSVLGGQVRLRGAVHGSVHAAGGRVWIDGPVAGDVDAASGTLALGPNARIAGVLRYRGREPLEQDPAAQVLGGIERLPVLRDGTARPWRGERGADRRRALAGLGIAWTAGLMLLAGVLIAAMPRVLAGVSRSLRTRPAASALLGFALVVCVPVAVLVLLLTVIGIPLALLSTASCSCSPFTSRRCRWPTCWPRSAWGTGRWCAGAPRRWPAAAGAGQRPAACWPGWPSWVRCRWSAACSCCWCCFWGWARWCCRRCGPCRHPRRVSRRRPSAGGRRPRSRSAHEGDAGAALVLRRRLGDGVAGRAAAPAAVLRRRGRPLRPAGPGQ